MRTIFRLFIVFGFIFAIPSLSIFSQVSIKTDGSPCDPSAMLDVNAKDRGLLLPRMSVAARNLILSPATGLLIYNTTANQFNYYNGSHWCQLETTFIILKTAGSPSPGSSGVAISTSMGTQAESTAMLDINDPARGMLIPRISSAVRDLIPSPANGLIIYNTSANLLNYYNSTHWVTVCASSTGITGASGSQASTGIAIKSDNSNADPSAILDVSAADKGVLIPRLTSAQRDAILPVAGLVIYNTITNNIEFYNGSGWYQFVTNLLSSPLAGIHVPTGTEITWNWNSVAGAIGYKWNTVDDYATATDMAAVTTKTETGLIPITAYSRYVWAYNSCGVSAATTLTQSTTAWACGSSFTIDHVAGDVAPVTKTVTYGTVPNIAGSPEKCWITRNLGADQQPTAVDDASEASAGWYWQFNRKQGNKVDQDGFTRKPATTWTTNILENNFWEAANDPCTHALGSGWRIPTYTEWNSVVALFPNHLNPWISDLKLHAAGRLIVADGSLFQRGLFGEYWCSNGDGPLIPPPGVNTSMTLFFIAGITEAGFGVNFNATGESLRCLRDEASFITTPTLTTMAAGNITTTTATAGGNVLSEGGAAVTIKGVCWSASTLPTIADNHTTDGSGTGVFTSSISGLTANTLYYARAYATNGSGTAYGNEVSFRTFFTCGTSITVNHVAGNVAPVNKTVTYGTVANIPGEPAKCWITRNLGADQQAAVIDDNTSAAAGWYWQFNRKQGYQVDMNGARTPNTSWITSINENSDWEAAKDPCTLELGAGWRIPAMSELENLDAGGGWTNESFPWNSGLKLHDAGIIHENDIFFNRGKTGSYWSNSQNGASKGWNLFSGVGTCSIESNTKASGISLRCLNDGGATTTTPAVTTLVASNIAATEATGGGYVYSDGGTAVTSRGICWSTLPNPTLVNSHSTNGSGAGLFTGSLAGLTPNTLYYVCAYANNGNGTAYGNEITVTTTTSSTCGISITINHIAGTVAPVTKTVTYGTVTNIPGEPAKCWITSNLGADHQALAIDDATEAPAGWYWQFNRKQGYKHDGTTRTPHTDWDEWIFENFDWQFANDPCAHEIGSDWRIPTYTEWNNVAAGGNWVDWNGPWNSGLKLHAAGYLYTFNGDGLHNRGELEDYWSSSQDPIYQGWHLFYPGSIQGMPDGGVYHDGKSFGYPLRCIKDSPNPLIPTVTTATVTDITSNTASGGGNVASDGGALVTAKGVCWSTSSNPTTASSHTTDASLTGVFSSSLTGLIQNTLYYVRAYATNSAGTAYGTGVTFTTLNSVPPTVLTTAVTSIAQTTATGGGNVTADGGAPVTDRGVCWSTASNPTIPGNSHTNDGSGTGVFTSSLTGLTANTLYHTRAYATNNAGTAYGLDLTFTTLPNPVIPTVTTTAATVIAQTTATSGGNVTADGGAPVTDRGVCWSTTSNPTIPGNSHTSDGGGTGVFISSLTGLAVNTLYHVRAYSTNSAGTAYGTDLKFTTLNGALPSVTTTTVTEISKTTATGGGNVLSDGGATVTVRGVCWSVSSPPLVTNNHTTNGGGTGAFTSSLTGLAQNTRYYVRAYATNSIGTAYGIEATFLTLNPCPGIETITINHVSGNVSPENKTVTYGTVMGIPGEPSKCWITSNLGADHQATAVNDATEPSAGWYWQFNRKQGYKNAGSTVPAWTTTYVNENLDWGAANDPCFVELGADWRIPTSSELSNVSGSWTNWNGPWNSGLKLHAAGFLFSNGSLQARGSYGNYWSSEQFGNTNGWYLNFTSTSVNPGIVSKAYGMSIRCLMDATATVTTTVVTNIASTTATSGGNVVSEGLSGVTARGICWSTASPPTIYGNNSADGSGTGEFVSTLAGLSPNTLYYVRAYATNSAGTAYGNEISFTTSAVFLCGSSLNINHLMSGGVAPVDKSVTYGTVTNIPGEPSKCWITSNLGASQQSTAMDDNTEASAGWYWQFNRMQGYMNDGSTDPSWTTTSISENADWQPANDPCVIELGAGWRIPTNTEWDNVNSWGGWANWDDAWASELKLHAAGSLAYWYGGINYNRGSQGLYWSSTQYDDITGYYQFLSWEFTTMSTIEKASGCPVRCLKE